MEEEVKEAVHLGLPVLTTAEVQEQLFRAVLRCGHFNLVQKYMSGKTTPSTPTTPHSNWTNSAGAAFMEPVVESAQSYSAALLAPLQFLLTMQSRSLDLLQMC